MPIRPSAKETALNIPPELRIHDTEHWLVSHRVDTILPGYVMVASKGDVNALHELSADKLTALGPVLAMAQRAVETLLNPKRVYIGRYGHSPGYPIHFHVIPVYDWVEALFWKDDRYRVLASFGKPTLVSSTDGAELTFFIWREFCESSNPPPVQGPAVSDVVKAMRNAFLEFERK
jgi:diadenosine tetraphosphate (Ap4A) HIT family hydrolase